MDPTCLEDPYEQQLFAVFNTYDFHHTGTLDHDGLSQLCTTLQLEERAPALIRCLLKNSNKKNVTFLEFKDALLQILRETQKSENAQVVNDDESPDREVSPKYICGTKKYGRRSRPKEESLAKETDAEKDETKVNKIQRSSSHSDVHPSKKRKSNTNLKRCTSFPDAVTCIPNLISQGGLDSEDSEISDLWHRLQMERNGTITQQDIKRICNSFDRNCPVSDKTVEKLLSKLDTNDKKTIEYEDFVEFFSENEPIESKQDMHVLSSELDGFQKNNCTRHITMCSDGSGVINVDVIVDMWENAGVASAYNLLCDLGFTQNQINISELTSVLETELKNLNDSQESQPIIYSTNPHEALLQASLTLYQSEVKYLKSAMKHMCAERDKLKTDISDAHARANLLTQEVDDNNARMEKATREKVKLLEQRHAETLRDITDQLTLEREQSTILHQKLEKRIKSLEIEEAKLKTELAAIQSDVYSLERENQHLLEQVSTLEQTNTELVVSIGILEGEKQKICDLEGNRQQEELKSYWEKISILQHEKNSLKDRNDELCIEVESLRGELSALKLKKSTQNLSNELNEENASAVGGITGFAIKRRGNNSNNLEPGDNLIPGSSHLRKQRKYGEYEFENIPKDIDVMSYCTSENGLEANVNDGAASISTASGDGNDEERLQLQERVAYLEHLLRQYGHDFVKESSQLNEGNSISSALKEHYKKLETLLGDIKMRLQENMATETCSNIVTLKHFVNDLEVKVNESIDLLKNMSFDSSAQHTPEETDMDEKYQNLLKVNQNLEIQYSELNEKYHHLLKLNKELETRCSELDNSLELMKTEYEKCEDYWALKLDEERQLFDQEQKQSNLKFQELFSQMTELGEQFAANNKLPTIDEASLEKQFTDLEDEYDKYKTSTEEELIKKEEEIEKLKILISQYENMKKVTQDISVQASITLENKSCETDSLENYDVNQINLPFSSNSFNWNSASKFTLSQPNSIDSQISCDNQLSTISCPSSSLQTSPRQNDQSPNNLGGNYPENGADASALRSSPQVHRSRKHSVNSAEIAYRKEEIKRLQNKKSQLDEDIQALLKKKDTLQEEIAQLDQKAKESEEPVINFRWKGLRGYSCSGSTNKQTCRISLSTLQELNIRLHQLDQRCKHFQQVIHNQQQQTDTVLRQNWMQYKGELADLHCMLHSTQEKLDQQTQINKEKLQQLARTDLLVKDLYIENSYLLANVQRLEHHCHVLTQANSNSSSV